MMTQKLLRIRKLMVRYVATKSSLTKDTIAKLIAIESSGIKGL